MCGARLLHDVLAEGIDVFGPGVYVHAAAQSRLGVLQEVGDHLVHRGDAPRRDVLDAVAGV